MKINDSNLNGVVNPGGLGGIQGADRARSTEGIQPGSGSGNSRRTDGPSDEVQLSSLSRSLNASDVSSPERQSQVDHLRLDGRCGTLRAGCAGSQQSGGSEHHSGLGLNSRRGINDHQRAVG